MEMKPLKNLRKRRIKWINNILIIYEIVNKQLTISASQLKKLK